MTLSVFYSRKSFIHGFFVFCAVFFICTFMYPFCSAIFIKLDFFVSNRVVAVLKTKETGKQDINLNNTYIYTAPRMDKMYMDKGLKTAIKIESLMQQKNHNGFESFILDEKEIAISENLAVKNGIKTGDSVFSPALYGKEAIKKYYIKKIIPSSYSVIESPMDWKQMVLLGYDARYEESVLVRYVTFLTQDLRQYPNNLDLVRERKVFLIIYFSCLLFAVAAYIGLVCAAHSLLIYFLDGHYAEQISFVHRLGLSAGKTFFLSVLTPGLLLFVPSALGMALYLYIFQKSIGNIMFYITFVSISLGLGIFWFKKIQRLYKTEGCFKK